MLVKWFQWHRAGGLNYNHKHKRLDSKNLCAALIEARVLFGMIYIQRQPSHAVRAIVNLHGFVG
jgi:hypothetical protein